MYFGDRWSIAKYRKNRNMTEKLNLICAVASILLMVVPILQAYLLGSYYRLLMMGTMGGWLLTTIALHRSYFRVSDGLTFHVWILIVFYIILGVMRIGNMSSMLINVAVPFYFYFVFRFYYDNGRTDMLALTGAILFASLAITFITTWIALQGNPYLVRTVRGNAAGIAQYKLNIGTVGHIYASAIVGMLIACYLQSKSIKKTKYKIIAFILMIFCFWTALIGSSAITIVALIISTFYFFIQKKQPIFRFTTIIIIFFVLILGMDIFAGILSQLAQGIENIYISTKVMDIAQSLRTGEVTGGFYDRMVRWQADVKVGLKTYLIGCGPVYQGTYRGYWGTYSITDHSQLFSDFGRYGILFTIFIIGFFFRLKRFVDNILRDFGCFGKLDAVWLMFAIMYICQPVFIGFIVPCVILFLVPASIFIIERINGNDSRHNGSME